MSTRFTMSLCFLSLDSSKVFNKLILEHLIQLKFDGLSEALVILFPYIDENDKITVSQLAKKVGYSRQAMHKNIKKLETLEYITLIEENQKEKSIKLTPKGEELIINAHQFISNTETKISEFIDKEDLELYKKNQLRIYEYLKSMSES